MCEGISPLHDALTNGQLEVAELLIDRGAYLTIRDSEGRTPADCLNQWGREIKLEPSAEATRKHADIMITLDTASSYQEPHINTTAQMDTGPRPFAKHFQCLHSDLFDSECSPPSRTLDSPDSALTSCHQPSGSHDDGEGLSHRPSRAEAHHSWSLSQSRKIKTADPPKSALPRRLSSTPANSWSSEEDDDFMPSPRPFKKRCVREEGPSLSTDQTSSKASSEHRTSNHPSTSVKQREKPTDHAAKTTSPKGGQSSASTRKPSPKGGQSSASTGNPSPKGGQSSASTGNPSPKGGQSSASTRKPSPKGGQSSASTKNPSPKGGQSSASTKNPSPKGGQSSASTKNPSPKGGQSSASTKNPSPKGGQSSASTKNPSPKGGQSSASTKILHPKAANPRRARRNLHPKAANPRRARRILHPNLAILH
ncbi:nascent polypeptide-associated complex subunit alpha, muscle-specific form-like [Carcharodon carcharias]|uniref:nascent polypeptide-associated complex subunit alpha, muscle-specific form-like n=1 Tax=Carcharodon carcharias TaxID=13397 RepID=UPI001B7EA22F|nr:nascent polypeptide-associated complex subunit alpha, muscle-specific form-like [Carcharodon carcharias]